MNDTNIGKNSVPSSDDNHIQTKIKQEMDLLQKPSEFNPDDTRYGYTMNLNYEIQHREPAITLNGKTIINYGEIFTVVSLPGIGKSNWLEFIVVTYLSKVFNVTVDTLGFDINVIDGKIVLLLDTERTKDDNRYGYSRIFKRLNSNKQFLDENTGQIKHYLHKCLIEIGSVEDRKEILEDLVINLPVGLLILDGILDFSNGMNDEKDAKNLIEFIRGLANQYDFSVVCTIHPNKNTENIAGQLGGFLYRYSRAVFIIRKNEYNPEVKELTNDFGNGKSSKANSIEPVYFTWDDDQKMMVSCNEPEKVSYNFNRAAIKQILNSNLLNGNGEWIKGDILKEKYMEETGKKKDATNNHIKQAVDAGLLQSRGKTSALEYALISG